MSFNGWMVQQTGISKHGILLNNKKEPAIYMHSNNLMSSGKSQSQKVVLHTHTHTWNNEFNRDGKQISGCQKSGFPGRELQSSRREPCGNGAVLHLDCGGV